MRWGWRANTWLRSVIVMLALLSFSSTEARSWQLLIEHDPLPCLGLDEHPVVDAVIGSNDVRTVRLYFRSDTPSEFYFVDMQLPNGGASGLFLGLLPKPAPETRSITYYIEAIDVTFNATRSEEIVVPVLEPCERRPAAAYFSGEPEITVGTISQGAPAIPPGFSPEGIVAVISTAGITTGILRESDPTKAIILGTVGAGAGVAAVAVLGKKEPPSEEARRAPLSTTPSSPPPSSGPSDPNIPTSPNAPSGPGSPPSGPNAPANPNDPNSPTSPSDPPGPDPPALNACFNYTGKLASCIHTWDASCSTGPILLYEWSVDTTAQLPAGTLTFSNALPLLVVNWNLLGGCLGAPTIEVQLTVRDIANQSSTVSSGGIVIDQKSADNDALTTTFTSELSTESEATGVVTFNDLRSDVVDHRAPYQHRVTGRGPRNFVDAYLVGPVSAEASWTFDFTHADHFVPGSFGGIRGQVVSTTKRHIVFRLARGQSERIRFWYALEP